MKNFLKLLPPNTEKTVLPGDGGHRVYTRLKAPDKSYILASCGVEDSSLKDFVRIQKLLKEAQVKVPEIHKIDSKKGLLLLEDLGNVTLEQIAEQKGLSEAKPFYLQALEELIRFQTDLNIKTPRFNEEFFIEEAVTALNRMKAFLKMKNKKSPKELHKGFLRDMRKAVSQLKNTPFVFCHRDFHSRNLMITQGDIRTIDFQDGGYGPFCYDLTSLFYDSYVFLSHSFQKELLSFYWDKLKKHTRQSIESIERAEFLIQLQFLQRGWKAAGCFAGFYTNEGKSSHLKYIPGTLKRLEGVAAALSYNNIQMLVKFFRQEIANTMTDAD